MKYRIMKGPIRGKYRQGSKGGFKVNNKKGDRPKTLVGSAEEPASMLTTGQVVCINVRRGGRAPKFEGGEPRRRELDQELEDPEGYTRRNTWEE